LLAGPAAALRFRSFVLAPVLFTGLRHGSKPGRAKTPTSSLEGALVYESPARSRRLRGRPEQEGLPGISRFHLKKRDLHAFRVPFGTGIWGEPDLALPARRALGEPVNDSLETAGSYRGLPIAFDERSRWGEGSALR
jgi:hypothetical protein